MAPSTAIFLFAAALPLMLWMSGALGVAATAAGVAIAGVVCFLGPIAIRYLFVIWPHQVMASRALRLHKERYPTLYQSENSTRGGDGADQKC